MNEEIGDEIAILDADADAEGDWSLTLPVIICLFLPNPVILVISNPAACKPFLTTAAAVNVDNVVPDLLSFFMP